MRVESEMWAGVPAFIAAVRKISITGLKP